MSRLFVRLFLDEDVSVLVAKLVVARGFEALTTRDAGRVGRNDEDQLAFAASEQMALLTHNRVHFETLAVRWASEGRHHSGVLIAARHPPRELLARLLRIINRRTADEVDDQVLYL
ncbi:MAG: DUF5615 family PIN-like protein [Planctomycetota bacterium]